MPPDPALTTPGVESRTHPDRVNWIAHSPVSVATFLESFGAFLNLMFLRAAVSAEEVESESAVSKVDVVRAGGAVDAVGDRELPGLLERVEAVLIKVLPCCPDSLNFWLTVELVWV